MARRRKKKIAPIVPPSAGPLPERLAARFAGQVLVFSDASLKRHGGLAAVLFDAPDGTPRVTTRTVAPDGSNELELQAALFALAEARHRFPGRQLALFSDNQDAVLRLQRAQMHGVAQDPLLAALPTRDAIAAALTGVAICWIKGHSSCRGNALADQHAAEAAA
ncbi:MAG: RNase H family protein [Bacteroidota bacterium]